MKSRADIPVTLDTVLQFGKHKGWTIGECVECDPSYVIWLSEDGVMKIPDDILEQAQENQEAEWDDSDNEYGDSDNWNYPGACYSSYYDD